MGGLWNYDWRTGVGIDGTPVHNSMYKHLWSNGPKECLEFPDYTFEQHFGEATCSYPPRVALRDYLFGFAAHHKIDHNWLRCSTSVKNIEFLDQTQKFKITACNKDTEYFEEFDHVIVASGHFSVPNMPHFYGIQNFSGLVMHSHDFRAAEAFKDKTVVVVGKSCSAEDVASQLYKYGAKRVIITHRKKNEQTGKWEPTGFNWPHGIEEKPLMKNTKDATVLFGDDSTAEVDAIILCTGYRHSFPFLDMKLALECENKFWIKELHMSVTHRDNSKLHFLSMQD